MICSYKNHYVLRLCTVNAISSQERLNKIKRNASQSYLLTHFIFYLLSPPHILL
jgi:hypothetical protein